MFTATMLAAAFLALLQRPLRGSVGLLPWLASAWALLLPLASFLQVPPLACFPHFYIPVAMQMASMVYNPAQRQNSMCRTKCTARNRLACFTSSVVKAVLKKFLNSPMRWLLASQEMCLFHSL